MKKESAVIARGGNVGASRWADSMGAAANLELPFSEPDSESVICLEPESGGARAIEDENFPFEALSVIAEMESWRKEINRPTTHIHKWWAQRLGTVFRAMTLGAFAPTGTDIFDLFYKPVRISYGTVFDPFMGSGTTLAEVTKVGARAIGRDINPVAHLLVKCALSIHDRKAIFSTFKAIERDVAEQLKAYYRTTLADGSSADVLYYFWVKVADCPSCESTVDLFSSAIFARHAYSKKFPQAQAVCPHCGGINEVHIESKEACCHSCCNTFDPSSGPAKGANATCPKCGHTFAIAKTVRAKGTPPEHRMYAKLVLTAGGEKIYLKATEEDFALYESAQRVLATRVNPYPIVAIKPGYNTNQVLGYSYNYWHEMFNARQLLCLSILADRIRVITDPLLRELFTCLFSGALEFNNMFASYKGEGTGAVRHMFSHHILKPERVPLEANLWGTSKSSGSFSTMFEGRIRRALDYADRPFELRRTKDGKGSEKVFDLSESIGSNVAENYTAFENGKQIYLSCGDSGATDLADKCVDAVLTDPPFFDNVHYSQLADFFHVWQRHILGEAETRIKDTTRSDFEVQNADQGDFTARLAAVWKEAHRVLKDDGLLAFTYHHSRSEGWRSVLQALMDAGFGITAAHPIKAEMSVAKPKQQAKEPIDIDIILVCRKRSRLVTHHWNGDLWAAVVPVANSQARRLQEMARKLSRNDVRVIVMAQLLRQLSHAVSTQDALLALDAATGDVDDLIEEIHKSQPHFHKQQGE